MRKRLVVCDPPENGWEMRRSWRWTFVLLAISVVVSLVALFVLLAMTEDSYGGNPPETGSAYRCFPAAKWSADDSYRPCVVVRRVEEDGSFKVAVYDADGDKPRYSLGVGVPDAYECKAGVTAACK